MHSAGFSISPSDLWSLIGSTNAAQIIDVRRRDVYDAADGVWPAARAGDDDHGLLERGFIVYDALFAYLRFASQERHNRPARAA